MEREMAAYMREYRARHTEINKERLAQDGIPYVCARCGTTQATLEVYPPIGHGHTLGQAMRGARYSRVLDIIKNRVLLCVSCRWEERSSQLPINDVVAATRPERPYTLRERSGGYDAS